MNGKLVNPTVADVIAILQRQKQDAKFVMIDADTDWHIGTMHFGTDAEGNVRFWGEYPDFWL